MNDRAAEPGIHADDDGFSLIEVLVGMVVLSIFMAIFGGSIVSMLRSVNRTTQTAYASSQINQVYNDLEREVRYASSISSPGLDSFGFPSVEIWDQSSGVNLCTQLRLTSAGVLQQRSWNTDTGSPATASTVVMATDVSAETPFASGNATATVAGPFATLDGTSTLGYVRLEIAVSARDSSQVAGSSTRSRKMDAVFAAINSAATPAQDTLCSSGRTSTWRTP